MRVERDQEVAHVIPCGELDLRTLPKLKAAMSGEACRARHLVVDLRELGFVDSSALAFLMQLDAEARRQGRRLEVVRGCPEVQRVFDLAGAERFLPFTDRPA